MWFKLYGVDPPWRNTTKYVYGLSKTGTRLIDYRKLGNVPYPESNLIGPISNMIDNIKSGNLKEIENLKIFFNYKEYSSKIALDFKITLSSNHTNAIVGGIFYGAKSVRMISLFKDALTCQITNSETAQERESSFSYKGLNVPNLGSGFIINPPPVDRKRKIEFIYNPNPGKLELWMDATLQEVIPVLDIETSEFNVFYAIIQDTETLPIHMVQTRLDAKLGG